MSQGSRVTGLLRAARSGRLESLKQELEEHGSGAIQAAEPATGGEANQIRTLVRSGAARAPVVHFQQ
jgi:hypothetical protein